MSAPPDERRRYAHRERDIEDYLWTHPTALVGSWGPDDYVEDWIDRQVCVPTGRIDLLGLMRSRRIAIIELKRAEITGAALLQLRRYAADVMDIFQTRDAIGLELIVIGGDITTPTLRLATALEISAYSYDYKPHWQFTRYLWQPNELTQRRSYVAACSKRDDFRRAAYYYMDFMERYTYYPQSEAINVDPA